jgi:Fe-only nitrogenase accessory protein AnfO
MKMKIAALVNIYGQTISFNENGVLKLYQKDKNGWTDIKDMDYEIYDILNIKEMNLKIRTIVEALDDCKIMIAAAATGIHCAILDSLGFTIWKIPGNPTDYLDYILEKEEARKAEDLQPLNIPAPIEKERQGYYYLDLKTIMATYDKATVTSKQILMPFFDNTVFTELEVNCDHIPHWFDKEFQRLDLEADIEVGENQLTVKITPKENKTNTRSCK